MWKRILLLSLAIAMLFTITGCSSDSNAVAQDNNEEIDWQIAGTIINDIKTTGEPEGQTLINLKAIGLPDSADITVLGYAGAPVDPGVEGCDLTIPFIQDEFVAVFSDLSLLFAKLEDGGDSYLCITFADGGTTFNFDMEITGGTGRFDGALGGFTATGVGHGQYFEGPLSAESGHFEGLIVLPD